MPNVLKTEKKITVIAALAEGMAIRQVERMTGVHRDTVMNLGVKVGQGCARIMDEKMRNLDCRNIQIDEIWGFIQKKKKNIKETDDPRQVGDAWTFCAIDADSKLVPCYKVGKRDSLTANAFIGDLASRLKNRVQLSSDGLAAYVEAVEQGFGADVDYGQVVKSYETDGANTPDRKYSPTRLVNVSTTVITGDPLPPFISTSYVERLNLTTRHHMRRLTRLTIAFSKKLENFEAAVGLHFLYYNFVKTHKTLRCTPAMAASVARSHWTVADIVEMTT
ncbi:MAG: IS1 family transposase [Pyrinomonadaceae bacterium]|nr:IS1 family transposase [Pyrinomonadaceae bacterium]